MMTFYNFLRLHSALKFGKTIRTPTMQAGLANRRLSFRDVFTSEVVMLLFLIVAVGRNYKLDHRLISVKFRWRKYSTTVA